jgi:small-conductance mechanosensitive channel
VYLAGPIRLVLRIAFVLLVAIVLRLAARRLIGRLTARAISRADDQDSLARAEFADDETGPEDDADEAPRAGTGKIPTPTGTELTTAELTAAQSGGEDIERTEAGSADRAPSGRRRPRRGSGRRSQRATALASVLSNAASVTIFTVAGVIILGDLGLNLAPVLASAGVLGIAIGFGAQNLVKDFLAGIFMLLEDQYGVGDYVDVGSVAGTVEAVSLRITRLRDVNGVVWHIRNGTIKRAGNETHGWARAVVDFPVPYQVPVAAARRSLERAAVSMWEEPAWHALMLDRPQIWGVQDVSSDTVLIRIAVRTVPQGKAEVASELRERLKDALDGTATATLLPADGSADGESADGGSADGGEEPAAAPALAESVPPQTDTAPGGGE